MSRKNRQRDIEQSNPFAGFNRPDMDALWHQLCGGEVGDDGSIIPVGRRRKKTDGRRAKHAEARAAAQGLIESCQQAARCSNTQAAVPKKAKPDKSAAMRAAERALKLAHYADAVLPPLPALGRNGRGAKPVERLLRRCTESALLAPDVETCDRHLDEWVRTNLWKGVYPPAHSRHPWHDEYVKARANELLDEPAPTDFSAERRHLRERAG